GRSPPLMRGRRKPSGLGPMWVRGVLTVGRLAGVLAAGWSPKLGLDLEGGFAVTLQPIEEASSDVLDQAIEIIRSRVDSLGVAEPEITRQGSTIEVSLPGVTDRERARELVGQTAELRFRPVLGRLPGYLLRALDEEADDADAEGEDTTTTTAAEGEDDATTTTAAEDGGEDVEGQAAAGPAVPLQDDTSTTTAPADTTTTAPGDTTTTTVGESQPGLELTPPEEDIADQPVSLPLYDDDGNVAEIYQLGPAGALGEIVQTANARLGPD